MRSLHFGQLFLDLVLQVADLLSSPKRWFVKFALMVGQNRIYVSIRFVHSLKPFDRDRDPRLDADAVLAAGWKKNGRWPAGRLVETDRAVTTRRTPHFDDVAGLGKRARW